MITKFGRFDYMTVERYFSILKEGWIKDFAITNKIKKEKVHIVHFFTRLVGDNNNYCYETGISFDNDPKIFHYHFMSCNQFPIASPRPVGETPERYLSQSQSVWDCV